MAKFETNLSKKDKQTIAVVLSLAAAFAFGWYLIRPAIISINDLSEDIDEAQITQAQYKSKIINLTSAEAIYGKAVDDLNSSTEQFSEVMQSSGIDRMMTNYVLSFGLFPEDLYITMPDGPVQEAPYIYSEAASTQTRAVISTPTPTPVGTVSLPGTSSSSGASDSSASGAAAVMSSTNDSLLTPYTRARESAYDTSSSVVECAYVTIVTSGTPEACQQMIDDLCHKESVRLTGFEWLDVDSVEQYNEETGEYEVIELDQSRVRVSLNLYMADITDYESAVSDAVEAAVAED